MDNNKKSRIEFLELRSRIASHFHWLRRNEYSELIESFLNSKIDSDDFDEKFSRMLLTIEKESDIEKQDFEMLKEFEINPESKQFGDLVSAIYFCCKNVPRYFSDESDEYLEEKFRDDVESLYVKIQEYL